MARSRPRLAPAAPDLPPRLDPGPATLAPGMLLDSVEVDVEVDVPETVADLTVKETRWTRVDLSGRRLPGLRSRDTEFVACDLSGAVLDGAVLERVVLRECRLTGLVLSGATLTDVQIIGCRADLFVARMATARTLLVRDSDLRGADLHEFTAPGAQLLDCDLTGANLERATLTDAALHGSTLHDLRGPLALRGTRIGPEQAVDVGALLLAALQVQVGARP